MNIELVGDKAARLPDKNKKILYFALGLPLSAVGKTWEDTGLPQPEAERFEEMFKNIPNNVKVIHVQGTAAPIINQLWASGTKIRGIDMATWFEAPFEPHDYPTAEIIVIWDVDDTISSPKVTVPIVKGAVTHYSNIGVPVIIESKDTPAKFESNYGIKLVNKIKIPEIPEIKWL